MGIYLSRRVFPIALCLSAAVLLVLGGTFAQAKNGTVGLDGDSVLAKMAGQFNVATDLTGQITFSIEENGLHLKLLQGDLMVKDGDHFRLDYIEPGTAASSTIITDGELVAHYQAGTPRPRIIHDPGQLGLPLVTDLVLSSLEWLSVGGRGFLAGEEEYLERMVYAVELEPVENRPDLWQNTVFWIDSTSYLPLRITGLGTPFASIEFKALSLDANDYGQIVGMVAELVEMGPEEARMRMDLARFDNNVWFPREVCVEGAGLSIAQQFTNLDFNVTLPDELFYVEEFEVLRTAFAKGTAFLLARNYHSAVKEFEKIVAIDPYNVAAHSNLGYAYIESGDEAGAIAEFEQVIMLAPKDPLGYNNLAYIYIDSGIYLQKALEMAEKAVELSPGNGAFRDTLGWAYFKLGDYEAAVGELTEALALMGDEAAGWDQATVHYHLGMAYSVEFRIVKAKEHLEKALNLDPGLTQAKDELRRLEKLGVSDL
ncbi:MAG: tetratricopeptide repeat protein [Firmicutes bacterium]|nr:tetratricopeptide repeat protein [Bacillota bacterium]